MKWLIFLAILAQSLDAYSTCKMLNSGNYKEINIFLGETCSNVIRNKIIISSAGYLVFPKKAWSVGLISAGAVGFTWNISRD